MTLPIDVPGSKSDTQRALFIAGMTPGDSQIKNALYCDDSRYLIEALRALGRSIAEDAVIHVSGNPQWRYQEGRDFFLGNAGTAVRFLSALSLLVEPGITIRGNAYMEKRPQSQMIALLQAFGLQIQSNNGCVPITTLHPGTLQVPECLDVDVSVSSQYLSGLLMVAPLLQRAITFRVDTAESLPYVAMTLATMAAFGVEVDCSQSGAYHLDGQQMYHCGDYAVEADWSSASYPYVASFITGQAFSTEHLKSDSIQGDRRIVAILEQLRQADGALRIDMCECPDIIPSVVAAAFHRSWPLTITGTRKLRYKETDRAAVMVREYARMGGRIDAEEDQLIVTPGPLTVAGAVNPDDDHRMVMSIQTALIKQGIVDFVDRDCINKSWPNFFNQISKFI